MPRKSPMPLDTITLNLFIGDKETLQRFYPKPVGYQLAVRTLVHDHCKSLLEQESRQEISAHVPVPTADRLAALGIDLTKRSGEAGGDDSFDEPA